VSIGIVQDMLRRVQGKQSVYSLEAELVPQPLAAARRLGLSDAWLRKLEDASPNQRQVLSVVRIVGGSPAVGRLKQGDILLAIADKVATRFREVELAVADKPQVNVTVWRDGRLPEPLRERGKLAPATGKAYDWPTIMHENSFQGFGNDFQPKHNVNIPQAMKMPAVSWQRTGDPRERTAIDAGEVPARACNQGLRSVGHVPNRQDGAGLLEVGGVLSPARRRSCHSALERSHAERDLVEAAALTDERLQRVFDIPRPSLDRGAIKEVVVSNGAVSWRDRSVSPPASLEASGIDADAVHW
jgi:hypothetical protein